MAMYTYLLLALCAVACFGLSTALPSSTVAATSTVGYELVNETSNLTSGNRQARTFSMINQLVNPTNIATVKSFLGSGVFNSVTSYLSLNLGSVVILSLLAGVAILIAPTLLSLVGLGTFAGIGRSVGQTFGLFDGRNGDQSSMTVNVYGYIDDFFKKYNVDAPACMQKFACQAAKVSTQGLRSGHPTILDSMLNYILTSSYVKSTLGHTKFAEAVKFGEGSGSCEIEYGKCPFAWEKVTQYIPFVGSSTATNAIPNPPAPTKPQKY